MAQEMRAATEQGGGNGVTYLERTSDELAQALEKLAFASPVTNVYNPLVYAREPHVRYLERYGRGAREALFVGMNPGPWGMAQTGVPFGEVDLVSSWLGIGGRVERPPAEHPRKPVDGFACRRSEVSGRRLWGLFRKVYGTPEHLFRHHFVVNYCPLLFLDHEGRNITPDKLSRGERDQLFPLCDRALRRIVAIMQPRHVIGVGGFAAARVAEALAGQDVNVGRILHPSPANPQANRGWENAVLAELAAQGINLPSPPAADIDGTRR